MFFWFSEVALPALVRGLNVKVVSINRDLRNMDLVACEQFWDMIEKEIKTRKTSLLK